MHYDVADIAEILGARPLTGLHPAPAIESLLIDSRRSLDPGSCLFFAFRGAAADGHDFVANLYRRGCRHFVVSREPPGADRLPGANLLLVDDVLLALQALATHHRRRFDLPVLGIAGSNGKTIVKEWLYQLLGAPTSVLRTPGSQNSQIGVPLSVCLLGPEHELALFEAGISTAGEMERLADIIQPTLGLLTNIGEAHSEGFSSKVVKLREKLRLFASVETLIFCADDPLLVAEVGRLGLPAFTWSRRPEADVYLESCEKEDRGRRLIVRHAGRRYDLRLPFSDPASMENAMHAISFLLLRGVDPERLTRNVPKLEPVALRLQVKEGIQGCTLIDDTYNADLPGLENALFVLDQLANHRPRTLILSDFLQSGRPGTELYGRAAELMTRYRIDRLIGVGRRIPAVGDALPDTVQATFFPDTRSLLRVLDRLNFSDGVVLVKGARRFAFERVTRRLERMRSRTTLEIHLDALAHNLLAFHGALEPETRMMAMVKASAYGGGSLEIARRLAFQGVDYLAVAYVDEGVELREGGIKLPIMVLNPDPDAFDLLQRYDLQPEIFSLDLMTEFAEFARRNLQNAPIHLNLDTGMHRLGFAEKDLPDLLDRLPRLTHLHVQSVFTHLPASENPRHDPFTHRQAAIFTRMSDAIAKALGYTPLRHMLNSAGILRFPDYQFDMVRLGLGLYGVLAPGLEEPKLRPVFHFHTRISQIMEVPSGEGIGYGRLGRADFDRRIGTIAAGYADGMPLAAGQGRYAVRVRDRLAPTVGSVCMDMTMIDLTSIPEARIGDRVDIFGEAPPVEDLARACDSIPYAIFTGISPRVKRVYLQES